MFHINKWEQKHKNNKMKEQKTFVYLMSYAQYAVPLL